MDSGSIQDAVTSLFKDRGLAKKLAENAYGKVLTEFSIHKQAKGLLDIYRGAMEGKRA